MEYAFAGRVKQMQSSAIREILKVTESPDIISFAGGLPAPEMFPVKQIRQAFDRVLGEEGASALQYSTTEGYLPLREYIAAAMREKGVSAGPEEVLITSGSQQGLDLLAKLFIDPGDTVIVESPSYLGAIQVFRSYQARFEAVPADEGGIVVEALERAIRNRRPKFIYLTPTFKNPTGVTMTPERRRAVAGLLEKYEVPLIEDDPYGELRYLGEPVPPLKAYDRSGRVIYLSTFSKTVAPGLRLAWIVADPGLMAKLVLGKQGADLHTGTLVQRAVYRYLADNDVSGHIVAIRGEYGRRRDAMISAMEREFPAGVTWTKPEGGMFLWVTLPPRLDATLLLPEAVAGKVAYVPGAPFFPDGSGQNCLRLNYSNSTVPLIEEGIGRLAALFSRRLSGAAARG
ncbi:MAG: PLP-dependent aminotransferase family protein [Peptococcaceae bacterium]|nr:PLP-dependent aminotransferase family protein [Peptococcaceae bacterium]